MDFMKCSDCGTGNQEAAQICTGCGAPLTREGAAAGPSEGENRHLEMVQIHSVQGQVEADVIQSFLKSHGIESFTRGLAVHSIHPFTVDGMGEIRILVSEADAERARAVLSSFRDEIG
jgi:hypothetical protein